MDPRGSFRATGSNKDENFEKHIYGETGLLHEPEHVHRLHVTVHKATNLHFGVISWRCAQVAVIFGTRVHVSPVQEHASFAWQTEFKYSGESHLVFEVRNFGTVLGVSYLPVVELLRGGVFDKALPLLHHGRGAPDESNEKSEIFVSVRLVLKDAEENNSLEEALQRCCQVRVSVHSLQLGGGLWDASKTSPYAEASLGFQSKRTPTARNVLRRCAEEFVYTQPGVYGNLTHGVCERYETVVDTPTGSQALPAYQKRVRDRLCVRFQNVQFVFWFLRHDSLVVNVFDDHAFHQDTLLASTSLSFDDIFQGAHFEGVVPSVVRTSWRESLVGIAVSSGEDRNIVGEIELEVELFQDPLACPSRLAGHWSRLGRMRKEAITGHAKALHVVESVAAQGAFAQQFQCLDSNIRRSLADVLVAAAVSIARRQVTHELDASTHTLLDIQLLGEMLELQLDHVRVLEAAALAGESTLSLRSASEAHVKLCADTHFEPLLPLVCFVCEVMRLHLYFAAIRTTVLEAAGGIADDMSFGRRFCGIVERYLLVTGQGPYPSDMLAVDDECLDANQVAAAGRCFTEVDMPVNGVVRKATGWAGFMPSIEPSRLWQTHCGDQVRFVPGSWPVRAVGTASMGFVAGALGGFSTTMTAELVSTVDHKVFCNPKYNGHTFGVFPLLCDVFHHSILDELLATFLRSEHGFVAFFLLYGLVFAWSAQERFKHRFTRYRELAIERLGSRSSPHLVICASGFLTKRSEIFTPWEVNPLCPWTEGQVCAVRFETDTLLALGQQLLGLMTRMAKQSVQILRYATALSNPVSLSLQLLGAMQKEFDDLMDLACARAQEVGRRIAHWLMSLAEAGIPRTVSFFGFSAAGVLVHACLTELAKHVGIANYPTANLVCDVVLIGAPVPTGSAAEWRPIRRLVKGRFINGFLRTDQDSTPCLRHFRVRYTYMTPVKTRIQLSQSCHLPH